LSDLTILTSDNPRQEDPLKIISDCGGGNAEVQREISDRTRPRESDFRWAIEEARPGDIVLLAGKGA